QPGRIADLDPERMEESGSGFPEIRQRRVSTRGNTGRQPEGAGEYAEVIILIHSLPGSGSLHSFDFARQDSSARNSSSREFKNSFPCSVICQYASYSVRYPFSSAASICGRITLSGKPV